MNYQPQVRSPRGVDPQVRLQSGRCGVCGKSRTHYRHEKCSKARQAAGFIRWKEPPEGQKIQCKCCHRGFRVSEMMGNECRDCYMSMFRQVIGLDSQEAKQ